jgi:hypothetical protein
MDTPESIEPPQEFDNPWKLALDVFFAQFLELLFPHVHADIDWSKPVDSLDKELPGIVRGAALGRRVVDKLVRVWLKNGDPLSLFVHVEVQCQKETDFPERMFVYNYRIRDRYGSWVLSLAVLGDENEAWKPSNYSSRGWGCRTEFEFPVAKLLDFVAGLEDLEASENLFGTIVAAHLRAMQTHGDVVLRHQQKLGLVRRVLKRGWTFEDLAELYRIIDWFLSLPKAMDDAFKADLERVEGSPMPLLSKLEIAALAKGKAEGKAEGRAEGKAEGRAEGKAEGRAEGKAEGRAEGKAEGRAEGKAEGLVLGMLLGEVRGILRVKFQRPADSLLERIKTITEEAKMAELLKVVSEAVSIGEVERALDEIASPEPQN